jgi:hypothetical protein
MRAGVFGGAVAKPLRIWRGLLMSGMKQIELQFEAAPGKTQRTEF